MNESEQYAREKMDQQNRNLERASSPHRSTSQPDQEIDLNRVPRISARHALMNKASDLRRRANQLDGLARSIPDNFPPDADAALHDLLSRSK